MRTTSTDATRAVFTASVAALFGTLLILTAKPFPSSDSFQDGWRFEGLWRDHFWQQASGFALLSLCLLSLGLSLRKRWKRPAFAPLPTWRLRHMTLGIMALLVLTSHTGLSLGKNLNLLLMINFFALISTGALVGATTAFESERNGAAPSKWRCHLSFAHTSLCWLLFVLIVFHIIGVYYF